MDKKIEVVKLGGHTEPFKPEKLVLSLKNTGATDEVAEAIVREVERQAEGTLSTSDIYGKAFSILHAAERKIAARYSVRRAIAELGPTGFPFEKFVADIFKARGYSVLTDQILHGACADHEVDVVAYNDKELIAVEVKFHNQVGLKSDLKVALYVKARIDDLSSVPITIAGKERKLTDSWLVTNTKFTQSAIGYAMCERLTLVGWNYPPKDNLQDLVAEYNLYPITCLTSLSLEERATLLGAGVMLVADIQKDPHVLRRNALPEEHIMRIMDEITILFPK